MANSLVPFFLPLLFILTTAVVLENILVVEGDPDLTLISALCGKEYDVSNFKKDEAMKLADLAVRNTGPGGRPFCSVSVAAKGIPLMYSKSTCSSSVSSKDCSACIAYAKDKLLKYNICNDCYGAQITVVSCSLRYETYEMAECPFQYETRH